MSPAAHVHGGGISLLNILINAGLPNLTLPEWFEKYGSKGYCSIFILRAVGECKYVGFFKQYSQTKFGRNDTKYYSPLTIGILMLILVLNT